MTILSDLGDLLEVPSLTLCTHEADGTIHAAPLWFDHRDDRLWISTTRDSRKIANLRRNPALTAVLDRGTHIAALEGAMISGTAEIIDDTEQVTHLSMRIAHRYAEMSPPRLPDDYEQMIHAQIPDRVVIAITAQRIRRWDTRTPLSADGAPPA